MARRGRLAALVAAAFVIGLIVELPARWLAGALPAGTSCRQVSGTIWNGACAGLSERGAAIGDLVWVVHPLALLAGKLTIDVGLTRPGGTASARLDIHPSGAMAAHGVHATFPLDRSIVPQLPPSAHVAAQADLSSVRWNGRRVTEIHGQIDVRGLTDEQGEALGDYRLYFPGAASGAASAAGSDPVGRLTDLGGPLAVEGTVRLTGEPGYVLDAEVAPRADAPPAIVDALRFLGTPDARGRRPLSLAGTF
jgi:general secretion pathway protein N